MKLIKLYHSLQGSCHKPGRVWEPGCGGSSESGEEQVPGATEDCRAGKANPKLYQKCPSQKYSRTFPCRHCWERDRGPGAKTKPSKVPRACTGSSLWIHACKSWKTEFTRLYPWVQGMDVAAASGGHRGGYLGKPRGLRGSQSSLEGMVQRPDLHQRGGSRGTQLTFSKSWTQHVDRELLTA